MMIWDALLNPSHLGSVCAYCRGVRWSEGGTNVHFEIIINFQLSGSVLTASLQVLVLFASTTAPSQGVQSVAGKSGVAPCVAAWVSVLGPVLLVMCWKAGRRESCDPCCRLMWF